MNNYFCGASAGGEQTGPQYPGCPHGMRSKPIFTKTLYGGKDRYIKNCLPHRKVRPALTD